MRQLHHKAYQPSLPVQVLSGASCLLGPLLRHCILRLSDRFRPLWHAVWLAVACYQQRIQFGLRLAVMSLVLGRFRCRFGLLLLGANVVTYGGNILLGKNQRGSQGRLAVCDDRRITNLLKLGLERAEYIIAPRDTEVNRVQDTALGVQVQLTGGFQQGWEARVNRRQGLVAQLVSLPHVRRHKPVRLDKVRQHRPGESLVG